MLSVAVIQVDSLEWQHEDGLAGALALVALELVELARAVAVRARLPRQDVTHALSLDAGALAVYAYLWFE